MRYIKIGMSRYFIFFSFITRIIVGQGYRGIVAQKKTPFDYPSKIKSKKKILVSEKILTDTTIAMTTSPLNNPLEWCFYRPRLLCSAYCCL